VKDVFLYNDNHPTSPIVLINEQWVFDCVSHGGLVDDSGYIHGHTGTGISDDSLVGAEQKTSSVGNQRGLKRERRTSDDKVQASSDYQTDEQGREDDEDSGSQAQSVPKKRPKKLAPPSGPRESSKSLMPGYPSLPPKPVQVIVKRNIPVDPLCPIGSNLHLSGIY
jgi:hypothetical protein